MNAFGVVFNGSHRRACRPQDDNDGESEQRWQGRNDKREGKVNDRNSIALIARRTRI